MQAMGIDMGTTTISMIMVDGENGKLLGSRTVAHHAFLEGYPSFHKVQDVAKLWEIVQTTAGELIGEFGTPDSIGMTGQMHGMLYVDGAGETVSPLYTWQDGCGNEKMEDGRTYAETLREATGMASSGYGLTTHFYLMHSHLVPETAVKMTTISDYIAMKLCGNTQPILARDMAASWGCFDLEKGAFNKKELERVGVDISLLPNVTAGHNVVGRTVGDAEHGIPSGVPVTASLGDNQASVLGSVRDLSDTVLVNIGTGSQVSFGIENYVPAQGSIELRPCTEDFYLMAGSGLCGGRAYAMLEQFYCEVTGKEEALYERMERQAREFLAVNGKDAAWKVKTTFSGTRSDPQERGSIQGIGVENFHPGAMTVGVVQGILDELYTMYREMTTMVGKKASHLVGSGNGVRKNRLLKELAEELFGMHMEIPECQEEAAYGAALQSLASAGIGGDAKEMQGKIRYI